MRGEIVHLIISNSSSVPIYEQIKEQIIEQILNDELKEDEMLPSIRSLSKDIKISSGNGSIDEPYEINEVNYES